MIKPSFASSSVASRVSTGSGMRYLGSGWISNFNQLVSSASLAMRATKTASFASLTPDVFGNIRTPDF